MRSSVEEAWPLVQVCWAGFMLLQSEASGEESKQTTVPGQKALKRKEDSKTQSSFWSTCFAHFSATPHGRLRKAFQI